MIIDSGKFWSHSLSVLYNCSGLNTSWCCMCLFVDPHSVFQIVCFLWNKTYIYMVKVLFDLIFVMVQVFNMVKVLFIPWPWFKQDNALWGIHSFLIMKQYVCYYPLHIVFVVYLLRNCKIARCVISWQYKTFFDWSFCIPFLTGLMPAT